MHAMQKVSLSINTESLQAGHQRFSLTTRQVLKFSLTPPEPNGTSLNGKHLLHYTPCTAQG